MARSALDADPAAVRLDDLSREVEPQADAAGPRARDAEELLEDALVILRRNALPHVLHLEPDGPLALDGGDLDAATVGRVPDGVRDEVREHELDAFPIGAHGGQVIARDALENDP